MPLRSSFFLGGHLGKPVDSRNQAVVHTKRGPDRKRVRGQDCRPGRAGTEASGHQCWTLFSGPDLAEPAKIGLSPVPHTYDDLGRIASAQEQDNAINTSFSLDAFGNRNKVQGTLSEIFLAEADGAPNSTTTNRIEAGYGVSYDAAGRVSGGSWGGATGRQFSWDPEGKMLTYSDQSTTTITYTYDPLGRRVMAQQNGQTTRYWFYGAGSGDHPIAEYAGSWQTDVQVDGKIVATVDAGGNATYLALSMLATTKMTVNGAGAASAVATYHPYGEESVSIAAEYKFTN